MPSGPPLRSGEILSKGFAPLDLDFLICTVRVIILSCVVVRLFSFLFYTQCLFLFRLWEFCSCELSQVFPCVDFIDMEDCGSGDLPNVSAGQIGNSFARLIFNDYFYGTIDYNIS